MKKVLPALLLSAMSWSSTDAQITITSNDMPVVGDTLRYSTAIPLGFNVDLKDTGANKTWNVDTLTPVMQKVDEYKTVLQVNPLYALQITSLKAYGYKVFDTLGGGNGGPPIPVTVKDVYTFFEKKGSSPNDKYVAVGFAANISGAPVAAKYDNEDELFFFPLQYGNTDTSDYYLNVAMQSLGKMVQTGQRITHVDAWGTIKTPYYTTAKNCIRVRSEVNGMDSVQVGSFPAVGVPRQTVDYYWLVQGDHYPALWVTTTMTGNTETVSSVRYRDKYRKLSVDVDKVNKDIARLEVYPNPVQGILQVKVTAQNFVLEVFDMQGQLLKTIQNNKSIDVSSFATGNYILRVTSDSGIAYTSFVKE